MNYDPNSSILQSLQSLQKSISVIPRFFSGTTGFSSASSVPSTEAIFGCTGFNSGISEFLQRVSKLFQKAISELPSSSSSSSRKHRDFFSSSVRAPDRDFEISFRILLRISFRFSVGSSSTWTLSLLHLYIPPCMPAWRLSQLSQVVIPQTLVTLHDIVKILPAGARGFFPQGFSTLNLCVQFLLYCFVVWLLFGFDPNKWYQSHVLHQFYKP